MAWWSGKGVKELVARGRPGVFLPDARLREKATGLGYVSGHSAVAFSLVAVLAPVDCPGPWRPVAVGAASFVALARLYAGAHLPLDVVGGAGLGVLAGTLARWALRARRRGPAGTAARLGAVQMRPRRSSCRKLSQPGRIGSQ